MNLIDKDALIEALGIGTDCDECEHERPKYYCGLNSADACKKIIEAPVISVTTESAAYIVGYNIDYDDWIDGRNFCMKCGADLRGGNNGKST